MRTVAALVGLAALLLAACEEQGGAASLPNPRPVNPGTEVAVDSAAAALVARARAVHGADVLDHAVVTFTFRGTRFIAERDGGGFVYTRTQTDSTGSIVRDVLSNDGLVRTVDGTRVPLGDDAYAAAETAVNSVVYFALLPYSLGDAAVQPRLVGADTLAGEPYDVVEVTFREAGGGRDHEDRYVYWFHHERATMDYLAYSFQVNGGGARFREAYHPRTVGGVRFADYHNYAVELPLPPLETLGDRWAADSLDLLSEIVLSDVQVRPIEE